MLKARTNVQHKRHTRYAITCNLLHTYIFLKVHVNHAKCYEGNVLCSIIVFTLKLLLYELCTKINIFTLQRYNSSFTFKFLIQNFAVSWITLRFFCEVLCIMPFIQSRNCHTSFFSKPHGRNIVFACQLTIIVNYLTFCS